MKHKKLIEAWHRKLVTEIGTDSSGNYGHAGRPGEVGGSGPGGEGTEKPSSIEKKQGRGHLEKPTDWGERWDPAIKAKKIQEDINCSENRAQEIGLSFVRYCGNEYDAVKKGEKGYEKDQPNLEEYIEKAPRWNGGTLYRGSALKVEDVEALKKGSVFDMKGVSSWSSDKDIAEIFSDISDESFKRVVFICPKPKRATSIEHLTANPSKEKEVLISGKSRFKIKGIKKEIREPMDPGDIWNKFLVITVEEV